MIRSQQNITQLFLIKYNKANKKRHILFYRNNIYPIKYNKVISNKEAI